MSKIYKILILSIFIINSCANAAENKQYECYGFYVTYVSQPDGPAIPNPQMFFTSVVASNLEEAQIQASQVASSHGLSLNGTPECRLAR